MASAQRGVSGYYVTVNGVRQQFPLTYAYSGGIAETYTPSTGVAHARVTVNGVGGRGNVWYSVGGAGANITGGKRFFQLFFKFAIFVFRVLNLKYSN